MTGESNAKGGGGAEFATVSFSSKFSASNNYVYYVGENGLVTESLTNFGEPIKVQKNSLLFFTVSYLNTTAGDITLLAGGATSKEDFTLFFVEGDGEIIIAI